MTEISFLSPLPNEFYAVSTRREPFSKRRDPECRVIKWSLKSSFRSSGRSRSCWFSETRCLADRQALKIPAREFFFSLFLFVIDPNSRFSMVTLSPQTERQKSNQVVRLVTLPQFRQLEPKSGCSHAPRPSVSVVWKHLVNSRVAFYSSRVALRPPWCRHLRAQPFKKK